MALTTTDLFRLEAKARLHADALRKEVAAHPPAVGPGFKAMDQAMLDDAKAFDAIGDLLLGLQGCWDSAAAEVRTGFKRMSRSYDLSKTYVLAVEEAEPKADSEPIEAVA